MGLYFNQNPYNYAYYGAGYVTNETAALTIRINFAATTSNPVEIAANLNIQPAFTATLTWSNPVAVSGSLTIQPVFGARLNGLFNIVGALPIQPVFAGGVTALYTAQGALALTVTPNNPPPIVGPLWAAEPPCPAPPWAAGQPCPPPLWGPDPDIETSEPWVPSELCD
jgi:hypothetical protein